MIKLTSVLSEISTGPVDPRRVELLKDKVEKAIKQSGRNTFNTYNLKREFGRILIKYKKDPDKLYDELRLFAQANRLGDLREIKSIPNLTADLVIDLFSEKWRNGKNRRKIFDFLYKDKNPEQGRSGVVEFISSMDKEQLKKLYDNLNNLDLNEAPQDYQNYLDNPDFGKDYDNEQQIQQIISTIKDRINQKKWTEYSDGSYVMKIPTKVGTLYVKYNPEGSQGLAKAMLYTGYKPEASLSPDEKVLNLYGKVEDNELRHELAHFFDSKVIGTKQMASQAKQDNAKYATLQGREKMETYYNAPAEFNAHWFEYIMPVVNQLFDDGNIPSLDQFTQFVKTNKDVDNFYDHLNDDNKNRFNKRLGVYYQAMQQGRPEVDNGKIETPGFIGKLKSLFQKRAA